MVETGQYNQKLFMRENRLWSSKPHFIKKVSLETCGNRQFCLQDFNAIIDNALI